MGVPGRPTSWGEALSTTAGLKNAQVPPSRWAILVLLAAQIVANSLPILKVSSSVTAQGVTTLTLWSRPAYAWSFVLLLLGVLVFTLSVLAPISRRLRVGVIIGGLMVAAGLASVLGFVDILLRTSGSGEGGTIAVGPIVGVIVGGATVLIGVLEFLQLRVVQHKRAHAGPLRYAVLFTPAAAIVALSVLAVEITVSGGSPVIPVGLVRADDSGSLSKVLAEYEKYGIAVDGWWSALTVWAFVLTLGAALLALIMLCRRTPTRVPAGFAIGPLLGLAGLFAVMWFFITLGSLAAREFELASVTGLDHSQFHAHLSVGGYLILLLGVVLTSLSSFEVADALQAPRIPPPARVRRP